MNDLPAPMNTLAGLRSTLADCAATPADAPRGLPGRCYTDPALFAHEYATVLRRGWHCVGRVDELAHPGDYLTLNLLGEPLIIVRDKARLGALSNLCRHRGMQLVEGSGHSSRFICPYHGWTYNTGGALVRALANYPENIPSRGEGAPELDGEARHRSTLFAAFPCHVVSVAASLLVSLSIRPLTPISIEVRWIMAVYGDALDGDTIAERIALWEAVNREDRVKLEAMQTGLGSVHATGGPLAGADYEGTVRDFL